MYSVQIETSDGTLSVINLGIEYFEKNDITLYRNDAETPLALGVDWQWNSDTSIGLLKGPEPTGNQILVFRNTDKDRAFNIYDGNAPFSRETLDENFRQMVYLAQEFTEGSGIAGLYRNLNMHGNRIVNNGEPVDASDAATKNYVDTADNTQKERITNLENTFQNTTLSYPWFTITTTPTDTVVPSTSVTFTKAAVFLNGVTQTPDYSYIVVGGTLLFAEVLPAGTMVYVRLGEDVPMDSYASSAAFMALEARVAALEAL